MQQFQEKTVAVNRLMLSLKLAVFCPLDVIFRFAFFEGYWGLRHPTRSIVRHFLASRTQADAAKLKDQLSQPYMQHWWNQGRINPIFHYLLDPDSLLEGEEYQDTLFRVAMVVDGKKQHANVVFGKGRLFSVELPKPIKFYKGKEIEFGEVTRGNNRQSITRAIDRLEHGKDFEG